MPSWYSKGLTQVAARFSSIFSNSPPNLNLLPSFPCQDLESDGVHLNPVSGLHYVLHLFDQTGAVLSRLASSGDNQLTLVQEQVRHHEDRMSFLEIHQAGLRNQLATKVAVDAEFADWIQNRNEEDWMVIQNLPRLAGVSDKEWPEAVKKQVTECISLVLHTNRTRLDFEVLLVTNPFRYRTNGPTSYNVRLDSRFTSKRIRDIFSGFFRRNRPVRLPPALKGLSFRNKITLETKVRIAILHQFGSRFKETNPGGDYRVRGFDPRPTLTTMPPRSAGSRLRTYNFIQAVTTLPAVFTDEHLTRIYQVVGDRFRGKLQSLFVVLNDDDHDRCLELVKASLARRSGPSGSGPSAAASGGSGAPSGTVESVGHVSGPGAGMDAEAGLISSLTSPPPPPPASVFPTETDASRAHDKRVLKRREEVHLPSPEQDRRGHKRHHQSSFSDSSRSDSYRKSKKSKKSKRRRYSSDSDSSSHGSRSGRTRSRRSPSRSPSRRARRSPSRSPSHKAK